MFALDRPAEEVAWFRDFLERFHGWVREVDFASLRPWFDERALAFGTFADVVEGREAVERAQWRNVWPTIDGFTFLVDRMRAGVSSSGDMAFVVVPWTSTGYRPDGTPFDRGGRATLVFVREAGAPWRVIHSHLSLNRGVPQQSHGSKPEKGAG